MAGWMDESRAISKKCNRRSSITDGETTENLQELQKNCRGTSEEPLRNHKRTAEELQRTCEELIYHNGNAEELTKRTNTVNQK